MIPEKSYLLFSITAKIVLATIA